MKLTLVIKMTLKKTIRKVSSSVWSHECFVNYRLVEKYIDQIFNLHVNGKTETWLIDTPGKSKAIDDIIDLVM